MNVKEKEYFARRGIRICTTCDRPEGSFLHKGCPDPACKKHEHHEATFSEEE